MSNLRDMRYIIIPEHKVTANMLGDEFTSPFQGNAAGVWANLRRVDDAGSIKCVVKFDVSCGMPNAISDYIDIETPDVYTKSALLSAIESIEGTPEP